MRWMKSRCGVEGCLKVGGLIMAEKWISGFMLISNCFEVSQLGGFCGELPVPFQ